MRKKQFRSSMVQEENSGDGDVQTVYGDLITFVMMLFVLLFVLSYNENKTHDFITEFQIRFGEKVEELQQTLTTDALLVSQIEHYIQKEDLEDFAQVVVDEHRVKLILHPPLLFESGKVQIKKKGYKVLNEASKVFKDVLNPLVIEGHTDNVPINNDDFRSNWELSFFRAFEVVKHFIYNLKYNPTRLSALGYGEFRPLVENDSKESRAQNRRIELNIIRVSQVEDEEIDDSF